MTSIAPERTTYRGASRWPCLKTISPGESDRVSARSASSSIWAAVRRGNRIGSSGSRKPSTGVGGVYSLITAWGRRTRRRLGSASGRDAPGLTVGRRSRVNRPGGSARRPLHERADPCLCGGGQLLQRKGGRPHGAFVEVRLVAEAERSVPRVELLGALEVADDLAVLVGVGGHPVPGLGREGGRARLDDFVEPLGHGAVRSLHLGDLREHGAFPCCSVLLRTLFGLQLFGALLHRCPFLGREPLGLLCAHRSLLCGFLHVLLRPARVSLLAAPRPHFSIPDRSAHPFGHAGWHPLRLPPRPAPIDARRHPNQLGEAGAEDTQRRGPISARDAHRCWTGTIRTSENSATTKFREFPFYALR